MMYLVDGLKDTSETSYTTVYSKLFNTRQQAEAKLKSLCCHVKYIREVEVDCCNKQEG